MSALTDSQAEQPSLASGSMGLAHIVFFVVAAAAPMAVVVGLTPPSFAFGNLGVPLGFVAIGLLYMVFSAGFTAMATRVTSAGAFYTYIAKGLGKPFGVAGAFLSIASYFTIQIGILAAFGVFTNIAMAQLGVDLLWWGWSLIAVAVVLWCGQQHIVFSGRLLGVCMIAELLILTLFAVAVVLTGGGSEGLSAAGMRPSDLLAPGVGVVLLFAVNAFIGFEATAIFGEEAAEPDRTIPRATFAAVIVITVFYAFVSWSAIQHYGPSAVQETAAAGLETFYLDAVADVLGVWAVAAVNLLLVTSFFAGALSFHNTLNRYFFALGRDGLLWRGLARLHPAKASPHIAGRVQALLVAVVLVAFAVAGADPFAIVVSWMAAFAGLGILAVQALVSVSVIAFFRKTVNDFTALRVLVAPALAAIALGLAYVMVSLNLSLLTGSESMIVTSFPFVLALIALGGIATALRIRSANPALYERLDSTFAEATAEG